MKISAGAIDQPRFVIVCTMILMVAVVMVALNIPVQRTPAISKAVVLVAVPYPGAQPVEVEEQITSKIEDALQKLKNVDFIASTSMRGSSVTQIIFLDGVDPDQARGEVKDLVDEIRRDLPVAREVQPSVTDIDFENTPLMLVNMTAPKGFDEAALKTLAEEVQEELETIQGISNTQLFGGRERELHVNVNVDLAAEYGLTLGDFRRALANFHAEMPAGELDTGTFDFRVRNETQFRGVDDIRNAIISQVDGKVIKIGDVATVEDTYRRLKNVALLNGESCATIIVNKEADINTLAAAMSVKEKINELRPQYPNIKFRITRDTSAEISIMFRVLGSSFIFGAMLVLVILAWTMGLRISFLVLTAIPLSSAVGLIALYALGIPISNMVIFAFILVLGMVVDGAIIVAENIHRHIERGEDPVDAAKIGIEEVGTPVIMADLTTVAAFLPMLLVPGIMGDFMRVMPEVVSVSLLGSVLVDHFFIPVVAARWYGRRKASEVVPDKTVHEAIARDEDEAEIRIRPNLGLFTKFYIYILRWALQNRWAVSTCTVLALVWAGFMMVHVEKEFFPPSDRGQFEVKYELPLGSSIHQTIAAAEAIQQPLRELGARPNSELVNFVSALGSSEGLASRLENDPAVGPEFGTVMVELLSPLDRERHERVILAELREQFDQTVKQFPGMTYTIQEVEEGPPGGAKVAVRFTGDDLEQLGYVAEVTTDGMRQIDGAVDVKTDYRNLNPEIVVEPFPEVVGMYGMSEMQVAQAIQTAINGDTTIELNLGDEDVTLRLQAMSDYRASKEQLERIMLTSPTGKKAPIGQMARLDRATSLFAVNRYDRKRAVTAKCDVIENPDTDKIFSRLREDILPSLGFRPANETAVSFMDMAFIGTVGTPSEGLRAEFTGESEETAKNMNYLSASMIIAVILIFAILVYQFASFRQACIVMLTVPLSFVGVVAGMFISDFPFSLATFIGLVSLTGIVVNDAIVVVDFINQGRKRGLKVRDAIIEAGINRLRPVMLTTATTIGGLLPLFLNLSGGAEFWQPLTGAVIFGLAFATILTLLVIPVAYSLAYFNADKKAAATA
ncbi:efflux RND transporter permease subunit [Bremerella sp. P1]|uniref:efflux RND transporter permease subunit n=1 Tax=Bremerella sp. P1 TaxID=3026424 RepID=UPI002367EF56|nr:efflux RND transporter permease subunit [Bremerella sp. P1]WDI41181.1 efflux RND transporter permease subunit [Bremerella sp. P1]